MQRRLLLSATGTLLPTWIVGSAHAAVETWVIGQSLPLSGPGFFTGNRVRGGALAAVHRFNASGGLRGRPVELISLDDAGDPARTSDNVAQLRERYQALVLLSPLGERSALAAAQACAQHRLPLIGPLSGAAALRTPEQGHVFTLRPDDATEARALVKQLQSQGISRVALLSDGSEPARIRALAEAVQQAPLGLVHIPTQPSTNAISLALRQVAQADSQALLLQVGWEFLEALGQRDIKPSDPLPSIVACLSAAGATQLMRLFRQRVVGYTSVVPDPESNELPLTRELLRDAEASVGSDTAVSLEGLEAYLAVRVFAEALRRSASGPVDPKRLTEALGALGGLDMGGWPLRFTNQQRQGSSRVMLGLRARDGRMLR